MIDKGSNKSPPEVGKEDHTPRFKRGERIGGWIFAVIVGGRANHGARSQFDELGIGVAG
jgi:hypothetical protein